ncbi:uncharacterized protein LOC128554682 [Mercenaria mercenaria]|uniref:uncharacterized protein LOC128554682 n=1 Tax=Mercenaria mercenaria TaxID=6596 RepID=UPI00234E904A|nr:uncharacterized protein LOC128554682 [Mercenaria mercenaria]
MSRPEETAHRHLDISSENRIAQLRQGSEEEFSQKAESEQLLKLDLKPTLMDPILPYMKILKKEYSTDELKFLVDTLSKQLIAKESAVSRYKRRYMALQHDSGAANLLEDESEYDSFSDLEDEQNSQDTPSDENGYVDQTEDREENETYVQRRYLRKHTVRSMKKGILPDQRLLNELCLEFGRKSKFLVHLCHNISKHIKALDENILHVWAAYTVKDRNKITFVVVVKENVRLEKTIKYSFVKRVVNEYSFEAEHVIYSEKGVSVDQHNLQRLKTSISNHATELMRRHKYLSIISGSSVRSRNYGIDQANAVNLVEQPCIVLYVHTKHFIPIDEEPFEELYDGVPVDVREGEFVPCVLATEYHESLKHSCQIGSSPDRPPNHHIVRTGSLGCFIDHPEYNLCGLTCAHVLLFPWGFEHVEADEDSKLSWPLFKPHDQVFQPASTNNAIGQLVQVIYHKGGSRSCGMEVALFQIDKRQPVSGGFPTMRNAGGVEKMRFDSGKSCGISRIGDGVAIKFGPVTDKTVGKFYSETDNTSVQTIKHFWDYEQFRITLHKQLCVHATDSNGQPIPFAAEGDSGSLVFKKEENGELVSVGIVEGKTSFGTTVVTPIKPILQKLGVQSIKSFEKDQLIQQLRNIPNEVDNKLKEINKKFEDFESGFDNKLKDMESSLIRKISGLLQGGSAGNS